MTINLTKSTNHYAWLLWDDNSLEELIDYKGELYRVLNPANKVFDVVGNRMGGRWEASVKTWLYYFPYTVGQQAKLIQE
jgi:hypothetical protein